MLRKICVIGALDEINAVADIASTSD